MVKIITAPSGRKGTGTMVYQMKFDSKTACDTYNINSHSFDIGYDESTCAICLSSVSSKMSDQGFTVDNRECDQAYKMREEYLEKLKSCRYVVVTYKNDTDHKYFALRLRAGDVPVEMYDKESIKDGFCSVIIPTNGPAYLREHIKGEPSNTAIYPFWDPLCDNRLYHIEDKFYIKHFSYFEDEDSAYEYCDTLLEAGEIGGYYIREKIDINMIDRMGDILSEESKQFILNAENGIFPEAPLRRAPKAGRMINKAPDGFVEELDRLFEERKASIRAMESEWTLGEGCKIVYVSASGNDKNNGLDPNTPKRTLASLTEELLAPGDVVLLKRGEMWRERLRYVPGVTYSAYGEGKKPEIRASIDGCGKKKWIECKRRGLYRFFAPIPPELDVGNIVFGDGEYYGSRVLKDLSVGQRQDIRVRSGDNGLTSNGKEYWYNDTEPMVGPEVLRQRFEYYHDYDSSTLYLYSPDGNPGELFDMVEISTLGNATGGVANGVTIDNLCIRFTGSHGIGTGTCKNFTVRNCEVGWIGGSIQNVNVRGNCRYGNAIEIFGGCEGYRVYNNYVYQCFDCGPTVQWAGGLSQGKVVIENDIQIYGNAIEKCNSPLEVWCTTKDCDRSRFAVLSNIRLFDNYCRGSGWGFGGYTHQKSDYNIFYGGGVTHAVYENAYMEDNYMWNIRKYVQKATPTHSSNTMGFHWRNNTIVKDYGSPLALMGEDTSRARGREKVYYFDEETVREFYENGAYGDNTYYYTNAKAPSTKR